VCKCCRDNEQEVNDDGMTMTELSNTFTVNRLSHFMVGGEGYKNIGTNQISDLY
jgi:hypothetical protein